MHSSLRNAAPNVSCTKTAANKWQFKILPHQLCFKKTLRWLHQGLILPTKKVRKISGYLAKSLVFRYCDPTKNYWILFSEIWPASCIKKLDPIFFGFIQKKWGFKIFRFIQKIGSEFFLFVFCILLVSCMKAPLKWSTLHLNHFFVKTLIPATA